MSQVWNQDCGSHTAKLVLLAIADNADDKGCAFPSVTGIAAKCNLSRRSVITQIQILEKNGFLDSKKMHGRNTRYTVKLVNDVHQCSSFTSEPASQTGERASPTGERASPEPSITIRTTNKKKTTSLKFDLPFQSEAFSQAWEEWQTHKKEIRNPVTLSAGQKALNRLSKIGEARAIAAIENSIAGGWKGIYEDKNAAQSSPTGHQRAC